MKGNYANIIVDISHEQVDRPFQYRIPEQLNGLVETGVCVTVPFGAGNTPRKGYVIEITDHAEYDPAKLKEIQSLAQDEVTAWANAIRLAAWMRETYGSTMIKALKTVLPVRQKYKQLEKKIVVRLIGEPEMRAFCEECEKKHRTAMARAARALAAQESLPYELVTGKFNVSAATLRTLEQRGILRIDAKGYYRNPVKEGAHKPESISLSAKQQEIADAVIADFDSSVRTTYLLHGITGSGKTEVYMELIAQMISRGRQAIVLIPEIALTYQTVMRFYARFGGRVSVMNSTLSQGEKYDQCMRAKRGEIDIIIGPRSALFTPFEKLGLIIIDEEHETSYKSESMPKYHARETAEALARLHGACVLLGSATPSMEAYYRARTGRYKLFELKERLAGGALPSVYTVDLREELKCGNRSIFSRKLRELLAERLGRKEQAILFLNRRGYAGFVSCRACGHVMKCPHCDVSLSEHMGGRLVCHYCGYEQPSVKLCPSCGSKYILGFKAGTQQIVEQLAKEFPAARVLRMDADTTRKKESYETILSSFASGEADILVGTQMIVKGHDYPNVTLVGILAADLSLSANDYRSGERTFQLLTQAAGRAGRGGKPGEVVIQTYRPGHYSIVQAARQDYEAFYEEELVYREMLQYPPAAHMAAVQIAASEEKNGEKLAAYLAGLARESGCGGLTVLGPAPAALSRLNDIYRFVFYIKHKDYQKLVEQKDRLEARIQTMALKKESVQFDFDPVHTF